MRKGVLCEWEISVFSKGVKMCNEWNILCRERKNYGYICAWDYAKNWKEKDNLKIQVMNKNNNSSRMR